MNDVDQVHDVLLRYASGIDGRDWDLFRTCFTEDCALDYGGLGRRHRPEEVTRFMQRSHSGPSLHRLSNMTVTVEGDRATARTYVGVIVTGPAVWGAVSSAGYYDDVLVRTSMGWRIARRRYTTVRIRLPGPLALLPSSLAVRLAELAARRVR